MKKGQKGQQASRTYVRRLNLVKSGKASWVPMKMMSIGLAWEQAGLA